MSNKNEATDIFYTLFTDFLEDLNRIRPNDNGLLLIQSAILLVPKSTLVCQFMTYTADISQKILERDESFLINNMHNYVDTTSFIGQEFERVKQIWLSKDITEDTRECIWDYLVALIKFGKIAIE